MSISLPTVPGPSAGACCAPAVGVDPTLGAERIAAVAKALAEPLRVQILDVLRRSGELQPPGGGGGGGGAGLPVRADRPLRDPPVAALAPHAQAHRRRPRRRR